ncbi:MAG TPA: isoleucine--tRNA ligase [Gammaproteobacteria bacterium]|jgi:isoleucyl-tRNA synthetase|nr:isoleucine--tRNA ligase [Gammaproteobacteria bacterium]
MTDYKQTLNLPQTDFPMKASLAQREPEILQYWVSIDLYAQLRSKGQGKPTFMMHDGPPYANGHIHIGHAVNKVLKDIIVKSKTLSGFDTPFVPGWDCHGLPIELNVEKKHGKPGHKMTATAFRAACREYAASQIDLQRADFIRLGVVADWAHPYFTMDYHYEANIIRSLAKIIRNNHVKKGYTPVHWCLDCASALAEAEVEYADKSSPAIDVRFVAVNAAELAKRFAVSYKNEVISIPIWTTTPWTLPANQAVAVNALLRYVLVNTPTEQLVVAEDLLVPVMQRYGITDYQVLASLNGEQLAGVMLKHPFYEREVPIILGDHVTVDAGTGAVHTAPAHGQDDYWVGVKNGLATDNPVGNDGCFTQDTLLFAGMHVNKANQPIIEMLQANGMLLHHATLKHSYPHCWRHKSPIIFRATPQWFISMDQQGLRQSALAAIERVSWVPGWGKSRIYSMIENRPDWCISRQRTWGVPLSIFVHKETGDMHPDTLALMEKVAQKVELAGIEAWFALDEKELLGEDVLHYQKSSDVLDVWFDSGVTPECVLKTRPELTYPADVIIEGSDQHRGWFHSLLLTSIAMNGCEPYKTVLTHGFTVDAQGRKMSKSIGNTLAPEEVIKKLGADVLRLWVASTDYRTEITSSEEILTRTSETYRRIRNTTRFLLANLTGFEPEQHLLAPEKMVMLDRFIVNKARLLQEEIKEAYRTYQFHLIVQKLHHFCVVDLGGFYLDVIKDRQYTMAKDSQGRRSAQTALYHIVHALVRWIAPLISFTAEEVWQYIPGKRADSVFLTEWYTDLAGLPEEGLMNSAYWEQIRLTREAVNKEIEVQRKAGVLGSPLEAEVVLYCEPSLKQQLDALGEELRFLLLTSYVRVEPIASRSADAVATDLPELFVHVRATSHAKCERCWHRRADVNAQAAYPHLCGRCVENITTEGEVRYFA